jgi:hypothetical protein
MRGTLVLAVLSTKTSFLRRLEVPLESEDEIPDTLQWWLGDSGCWRIRTYSMNHDIHTYINRKSPQTTLDVARTNNQKNYGDLIKFQPEIHFVDCTNSLECEAEFQRIGLVPRMEIEPD